MISESVLFLMARPLGNWRSILALYLQFFKARIAVALTILHLDNLFHHSLLSNGFIFFEV